MFSQCHVRWKHTHGYLHFHLSLLRELSICACKTLTEAKNFSVLFIFTNGTVLALKCYSTNVVENGIKGHKWEPRHMPVSSPYY